MYHRNCNWSVFLVALAYFSFSVAENTTEIPTTIPTTTHGPSIAYNTSSDAPYTTETEAGTPMVTMAVKVVEKCDTKICVEDICKVNGSVSRPTFYARCPDSTEGEEDLSYYCMCANAYHVMASEQNEPSYVAITPDINCIEPETQVDKNLCQQTKCEGINRQQIKKVHMCESQGKYYCACFN